jgi:dimeric dUTPase (all-alpha-NTP-PPase superfamily)
MNLSQLFMMQKKLDERIEIEHGLQDESLFERKVLALLVELGELANETRCFKFWSKKPASDKVIILEEYVDGLHFILSLGIEGKLEYEEFHLIEWQQEGEDLVSAFSYVYESIITFKKQPSKEAFFHLLKGYLSIGQALEFRFHEIEEAYLEKNSVNHTRQDEGY